MLKKLIILSLLLLSSTAYAACNGARLKQAFFSLLPVPGHPLDALSVSELTDTPKSTLYFYSDILGNTTGATLHRWRHNGKTVANRRLTTGKNEWQSWSRLPIKPQAGQWEVDIYNANHCLIGKKTLHITASNKILQQAKAKLAKQDPLGAKLLLKQALSQKGLSQSRKKRLAYFLQHQVALAQATQDVQNDRFVAATGRLTALKGKLPHDLAKRRDLLVQKLQKQAKLADKKQTIAIQISLQALADSLAPCPVTTHQATALLQPLLDDQTLYITSLQKNGKKVDMSVSLPSGHTHSFSWQCPSLIPWQHQIPKESGP